MALTFASREEEPSQISYRFTARLIKNAKGATPKILDIACATGESTAALSRALPNAEICGMDMDPRCIAVCERTRLHNVRFMTGDALATGFPDNAFDAIVSGHTIEHMDEPRQKLLLREMRRILKPDGVFIVSTPDVSVLRLQGSDGAQPDHVRELEKPELIALLKEAGFHIAGIWGQGVMKTQRSFTLRRILNFLKRLDVFRMRRLMSRRAVNTIDETTHPFELDFEVRPLAPAERAYNMIAVCGK